MSKFDFHNIITNTDSYKNCHYALYPPGTEYVSAYIEARGGEIPAGMFVGLQAFLREYLSQPVTLEHINEAEFIAREQGMHFNRDIWMGILQDHDGYLPLEIEAVPEGTVLPIRNVLLQVVNTDPKYHWVTTFIETALIRAIWYPMTVGTVAWRAKQQIRDVAEATSDSDGLARRVLHDYGARGVSSLESAALGGLASLVSFSQSDTISGIVAAKRYYNAGYTSSSGPNTEHAVLSSWGRENEAEAIKNMLDTYRHVGVAIVLTDTYNHEHAVKNIIGGELKETVENFPGLVGIRPDSGDPVQVTADTAEWLMDSFGYTVNSKGFKVLPSCVKVVQGDGVTRHSFPQILMELERRGLAIDNAVYGMGGGLLQHVNRDTMAFGMKVNAVCVNGEWRDVSKAPSGDGVKHSKGGRLALVKDGDDYRTVRRDSVPAEQNLLQPVFRNGKLLKMWEFDELIANSEKEVPESYYVDAVAEIRAARQVDAATRGVNA
ncbi:nicotinate phosphoribosyltransferase [Nocardioides immobilis]|uniref:Nicotinamide phosphoribosyltransferase n=1 Tax=Nocardioides immobilis TaxID=2049295 RepID=A0A417Y989_9ACTN|nr:nicotinate phosphoribosyltransferase [Nocardioides immobilis]RHW29141.1 nicotinate phosphoribosyltransferase [Nocardioides immobilis]